MEKLRIDKWLWAARFYKTRSLASEEIAKGRVRVNDAEIKPAREVKSGDTISLRQGPVVRTVLVRAVSSQRSAAPIAQLLYEETPASIALRLAQAEQRLHHPEPADSLEHGRPTKRDRRQIDNAWGDRWSAQID
jgi:ribosome-associated heat shock protein Hsp15